MAEEWQSIADHAPVYGPTREQLAGNWDSTAEHVASGSSVTDQLKDQGFLDSAWNAIKGTVSTIGSAFSGEYSRQTAEQLKRYQQLDKSGTPEQKREFSKQVILGNIPFASTAYKATHGNVPGAAGDITGLAALGLAGAVASSPAAGEFTKAFGQTMEEAPLSQTGKVLGRVAGAAIGRKTLGGLEGTALGGYAGGEIGARLPAVPGAVGAGLRAASQALTRPGAMPVIPPGRQLTTGDIITPPAADTSFVRGVPATYPEVIPQVLRGAQEPATARAMSPAEAAQVFPDAYTQAPAVTPSPAPAAFDPQVLDNLARHVANGKPYAQMTEAEQTALQQTAANVDPRVLRQMATPQPPPNAPALPEPPKIEPQVSIAPAQPAPAAIAAPPVAALPEVQATPQLPRTGEEATASNRIAKAGRFADAFQKAGIDPKDLKTISKGYVSQSQIEKGMQPRWGNIAEQLGEQEPSMNTVGEIIHQMTARQKPPAVVPPAAPPPAPALPEPPVITPGQDVIYPGEQPAVMRNPRAADLAAQLAERMRPGVAEPAAAVPPSAPVAEEPAPPVETPTAVQPATNAPWQMTRAEYLKSRLSPEGQTKTSNKGFSRTASLADEYKQKAIQAHRNKVAAAVKEGLDVPPEVLADYPDLANPAAGGPAASMGTGTEQALAYAKEQIAAGKNVKSNDLQRRFRLGYGAAQKVLKDAQSAASTL